MASIYGSVRHFPCAKSKGFTNIPENQPRCPLCSFLIMGPWRRGGSCHIDPGHKVQLRCALPRGVATFVMFEFPGPLGKSLGHGWLSAEQGMQLGFPCSLLKLGCIHFGRDVLLLWVCLPLLISIRLHGKWQEISIRFCFHFTNLHFVVTIVEDQYILETHETIN